jgi:hypothetical protein
MEMVGHKRVRLDCHGVTGGLVPKERQKELVVRRTPEHGASIVAALHDVVREPRKADASSSSHMDEQWQVSFSSGNERFQAAFLNIPDTGIQWIGILAERERVYIGVFRGVRPLDTRGLKGSDPSDPGYFSVRSIRINSMGSGKMMVEFCSAAISVSVCRYRSVIAAGCESMMPAASASLTEAINSPSA